MMCIARREYFPPFTRHPIISLVKACNLQELCTASPLHDYQRKGEENQEFISHEC